MQRETGQAGEHTCSGHGFWGSEWWCRCLLCFLHAFWGSNEIVMKAVNTKNKPWDARKECGLGLVISRVVAVWWHEAGLWDMLEIPSSAALTTSVGLVGVLWDLGSLRHLQEQWRTQGPVICLALISTLNIRLKDQAMERWGHGEQFHVLFVSEAPHTRLFFPPCCDTKYRHVRRKGEKHTG